MDIQVHKVKNDWTVMPGGLTWYFIGAPKTGKTTQASKWHKDGAEKVILLDTDLGADFVESANVIPIVSFHPPTQPKMKDGKQVTKKVGKDIIAVEETVPPEKRGYFYRTGKLKGTPMPVYAITEAIPWLKANWDKLPYEVAVIDTIDQVNEWIEEIVTEEMNIANIGDAEWGKGWSTARKRNTDSVRRFQKFLKRTGSDLILTSHSKTSSVTDGKVQLSPDLPRGLANALTAKADVIGYSTASKADEKYYISFLSYDERTVGSRLEPLKQKKILFDYSAVMDELNRFAKQEA